MLKTDGRYDGWMGVHVILCLGFRGPKQNMYGEPDLRAVIGV